MLRLLFRPGDLSRTRVAPALGPFAETLMAFQLARQPAPGLLFSSWLRPLQRQLGPGLRPLRDFYTGGHALDLTTIVGWAESFDEGIDNLRHAGRKRLLADAHWLAWRGREPSPSSLGLLGSDPQPRQQLTDAIISFHTAAVLPHWAALGNHLGAETAARMRTLGSGGVDRLLATLCPPVIRWYPPILHVMTPGPEVETVDLAGRGLVITPAVFVGRNPAVMLDPANVAGPLTLIYPAVRELATARQVWHGSQHDSQALGALLGRTRAIVLELIADGCGTGDLARRAGISPAAASQHAAALRGAGLVSRHREGQAVLHTLTPLGTALLDAGKGADI